MLNKYLFYMLVLKINKSSLKKAIDVLRQGGIIVYPTDTAYGIGCQIFNEKSIDRIFEIKQRPKEKSLPVLVNSVTMCKKLVKINSKAGHLIKKFWPGGLTLVLPLIQFKEIANYFNLSKELVERCLEKITSRKYKLGVRLPNSKIVDYLIKKIKIPLIGTSANVSGKGSCYSAEDVVKQFKDRNLQPDLILDGGKLENSRISTVLEFNEDIKILRPGAIRLEEIKSVIKK